MSNFIKLFNVALVGTSLLAFSYSAKAQSLALRIEPGVAIPTTDPQANRFDVGGALAVKPEVGLGSYLGVGPSIQVIQLPSKVSGSSAGNAWSYGGFIRVKRPHDNKNTGHDFSAFSPWIDLDLKLVHTDPLDRLGMSVGVGVSVPTSDSRWLWVGPFARYDLVNQEDGKVGINTNSAKTLILGVSFEFGAATKKREAPPCELAPCKPLQVKVAVAPDPVVPVTTYQEVSLEQVIYFAHDSSTLDKTANAQLTEAVKKLTAANSFKFIRIEGHASSDGQVVRNNTLAQNRANSILEFFSTHGVPREKLIAFGFGSRFPVATNKTQSGRAFNRRAEFAVKFIVTQKN